MLKKSHSLLFLALISLGALGSTTPTYALTHHYVRHTSIQHNSYVHRTNFTRHTYVHRTYTHHASYVHHTSRALHHNHHSYSNYTGYVSHSGSSFEQVGLASWYGPQFQNRETASGTRFNMYGLTAASKTIPLNTYVNVTNVSNGKTVTVKVNDRGPYVGNRILDLSYGAAQKLGMVGSGVTKVDIKST